MSRVAFLPTSPAHLRRRPDLSGTGLVIAAAIVALFAFDAAHAAPARLTLTASGPEVPLADVVLNVEADSAPTFQVFRGSAAGTWIVELPGVALGGASIARRGPDLLVTDAVVEPEVADHRARVVLTFVDDVDFEAVPKKKGVAVRFVHQGDHGQLVTTWQARVAEQQRLAAATAEAARRTEVDRTTAEKLAAEQQRLAKANADQEKARVAAIAALAAEQEKARVAALAAEQEKARVAGLAAEQKKRDDEQKARAAKLAEQQRLQQEQDKARLAKIAADEEKARFAKIAADEEQARLAKIAAEQEKARLAKIAAEQEKARLAKIAAEQEKARLAKIAADDEKARLAKIAAEQEKARLAKIAAEQEKARLAKIAAEQEKARLAKIAADEEKARLANVAAEQEKARLAKVAADQQEKARLAKVAAEEEKARLAKIAADEEKARLAKIAAEQEQTRLAKIAEQKQRDDDEKARVARLAAEQKQRLQQEQEQARVAAAQLQQKQRDDAERARLEQQRRDDEERARRAAPAPADDVGFGGAPVAVAPAAPIAPAVPVRVATPAVTTTAAVRAPPATAGFGGVEGGRTVEISRSSSNRYERVTLPATDDEWGGNEDDEGELDESRGRSVLSQVTVQRSGQGARVGVRVDGGARYQVARRGRDLVLTLVDTRASGLDVRRVLDARGLGSAVVRVMPTVEEDRRFRIELVVELRGQAPVRVEQDGQMLWLEVLG
jgi:hypothetical protein